MYHRLAEGAQDGAITPEKFRAQMLMVKKRFKPLTMSSMLDSIDQGIVPKHAVIITFDDGYDDFADYAFPILDELNIPVTLFVTTGFINQELWLWPDQLRYAIKKTNIKAEIEFTDAGIALNAYANPVQSWETVANFCMTLNNDEKLKFIDRLFRALNVEMPGNTPEEYSAMTWDQLRYLSKKGVEIGSHTHSHPIMTKLKETELRKEVELSKSLITENLGHEKIGFCYPNGMPQDINEREERIVRESGYRYAVVAYPGKRPLKNRWNINRYPADSKHYEIEKTIYGLKYLSFLRSPPNKI